MELKLEALAVQEEEKGPLREALEEVAVVELEELTMARVTEVQRRAEEAVVLRAVQEPKLLEEAAAEGVVQREPVLLTLAAVEEGGPAQGLRELGQPKLGPAEEEPEAAWPWTKACEMLGVVVVSSQSAAAVPLSSSSPLLRPVVVWEVLVPGYLAQHRLAVSVRQRSGHGAPNAMALSPYPWQTRLLCQLLYQCFLPASSALACRRQIDPLAAAPSRLDVCLAAQACFHCCFALDFPGQAAPGQGQGREGRRLWQGLMRMV